MKVMSFKETIIAIHQNLEAEYLAYDTFSYLLDEGVDVEHLEAIRREMGMEIEEFCELVEHALLSRINRISNPNPYGLMGNGNRRKPRCEVEKDY